MKLGLKELWGKRWLHESAASGSRGKQQELGNRLDDGYGDHQVPVTTTANFGPHKIPVKMDGWIDVINLIRIVYSYLRSFTIINKEQYTPNSNIEP